MIIDFIKRWFHYLFKCPSFWTLVPAFQCPDCDKMYRCYWDGNDCACGTINLCDACYIADHAEHDPVIVAEMDMK